MTSAAKHTAGPWSVDDEDLSSKVRAPDGTMLAQFHQYRSGNIGADERKANARLGAAAPDLLTALSGLVILYVELVESGDAGFWDAEKVDEVIAARTAIAKAGGKLSDDEIIELTSREAALGSDGGSK